MTATTEPARITAGDTVAWSKSIADYPASAGWALNYRLINASAKIDIAASASGNDYAVLVTAATSAGWTPGRYDWISSVTKGAERYTIERGVVTIDTNLAAQAAGLDIRSDAKKILGALMVAYAAAATNRAFVQDYEIAGRRMSFNSKADWLLEINFWKREVASEARTARLAAGLDAGNKIYVRF
jgi:hypothetical protein